MIKTISDEYVYKKEVDWSLFNYGFAIPIEHQVVFSQVAGRFIQRGESKDVNLYLNGKYLAVYTTECVSESSQYYP